MLGRNSYTKEELAHAKTAVADQLGEYKKLVKTVASATTDKKVGAAFGDFETVFFNNMVVVLDRYFVHRIRVVTGKDTNPLNEVEMLCESMMSNDGILASSTVIKWDPEQSVVKLKIGDPICLTAEEFDRLSTAFFAEIKSRFL